MGKLLKGQGAVAACLALVVLAEAAFVWRDMKSPRDEAPAVAASYSKDPQACAEQSPWFVCGP